jgi:peroxiredoxin
VYRDRYAELQKKGAQVVAISTDDAPTLAKFKASLGAPFVFLSDPGGKVSAQFAGTSGGVANRATIVLDQHGNITHVSQGMDAVIPSEDINSCPSSQPSTT